ncbi:helix-turn-helix domain-containing protein [uncultured Desulfovibrio sp.]|mgnify:FL=1|uniref:helix-turn-helix domain-containing protein n=1 Tax=uncultured Desulfovibrio sp. TaxID=167968 RepID=UPI002673272C|nr:helix-turn-helix transcriptional regulator [uncultured Desulfovibrio sp.]
MRKRPPSRFGAALVQECKKRNITQYRLAQLLGRSTRYLNNIEHDRSEPRFTTILLLAQAIGMEPGELVDAAAKLSWAALAEEKQDSGNEQLEMTVGKKKEKKNA